MNKQNLTIFIVALVLIGGTALGMHQLKHHQRLGLPGVKTSPIAGSQRLDIYLPERVLDCSSTFVPTDKGVLAGLPQDTSFMQRRYIPAHPERVLLNNTILQNVVLMGTDRTSIHKPQFCLTGSGWNIDGGESAMDNLRVESPRPYDLPVMKLVTSRDVEMTDGKVRKVRGIYVYWFVADNDLTASHAMRMWKSATHLLKTGELERWAYVSCFAVCMPGDEAATYDYMKKFITASVPQFQLATEIHAGNRETVQTAAR